MGRLLLRAVQAAGLSELAERALGGGGLRPSDLERLRGEDILLVAGLADLVRAKLRGDEVRIVTTGSPRDASLYVVDAALGQGEATGADFLREVALARLLSPKERSIAVSFDAAGLELAQTALLFGADTLFGELSGKRTLPLLDGPEARRAEILGLCERAGRRVRFVDAEPVHAAQELRG